ncbi:MAG: tyrosine-type recombinase/integrase [Gemmataceae bacterium]|nr:tyrosine-type recombinase/integrase [Gemmataceae bacterium]
MADSSERRLSVAAPGDTLTTLRPADPDSLAAWVRLYGAVEAGANAANTVIAKGRDLGQFMRFFADRVRSDHPDQWTKSVTAAFLRHLEDDEHKKPTTVNRMLATLRHCAGWVHHRRPFLAGDPCDGVRELVTTEPAWKGLSDVAVMRLRSAAEQLVHLKARRNQHPLRDRAIFLVLLHTGLRVSELLSLDRVQYRGRSFHDVKRKGKVRTAKVFVPPEAREALDAYLAAAEDRGPLFPSRAGVRLARQHVDRLLKQLVAQANSRLPATEQIRLSPHVLRHTFLRKVTQKHGVEFAMEAAGHASSKYIWRYVRPSEEQKEAALEDLF